MNIGKRLLVAIMIFVFLVGWGSFDLFHDDVEYKIAFVDMDFIVSGSAKRQLIKLQKQQQYQDLYSWYENKKIEIETYKDKKEKEDLLKKINIKLLQKQNAIAQNYTKKLRKIDDEIAMAIEEEAISLGYDMVVTKKIVLCGGEDITKKVIKKIK